MGLRLWGGGGGGAEMMGWWDGCLGRGAGDVSWREELVIGIVDVVVVLSSVDVEGLGREREARWEFCRL